MLFNRRRRVSTLDGGIRVRFKAAGFKTRSPSHYAVVFFLNSCDTRYILFRYFPPLPWCTA